MGKQRKCSNVLNGLINGATVWFSAPLYIGGCPNLHHTFGDWCKSMGRTNLHQIKPFTGASYNF